MKPLSESEFQQLSRLVYRDLIMDTLGNLALGLGLYLVFSQGATNWPIWLQTPYAKALLIGTGIINLRFFFVRLRRLQAWQQARQERERH
ncbi:hypothetical protein [Agitococcus lubricus]|uniref:YrhK-like protein n=1 Tax=Agitococcus lubricus TaxID=1077255 RepID=A0A2T5J1T8_9GAMM|nr:hypothetical protein [Agitococcus lubricus]PTQ90406.1 hypothetical protein C8N29_103159 [Agitococcus lubricus]